MSRPTDPRSYRAIAAANGCSDETARRDEQAALAKMAPLVRLRQNWTACLRGTMQIDWDGPSDERCRHCLTCIEVLGANGEFVGVGERRP